MAPGHNICRRGGRRDPNYFWGVSALPSHRCLLQTVPPGPVHQDEGVEDVKRASFSRGTSFNLVAHPER